MGFFDGLAKGALDSGVGGALGTKLGGKVKSKSPISGTPVTATGKTPRSMERSAGTKKEYSGVDEGFKIGSNW